MLWPAELHPYMCNGGIITDHLIYWEGSGISLGGFDDKECALTRPNVRAHHIIMDGRNGRIFAVYPQGTPLADLEVIAAGFAAQAGLRARALAVRQSGQLLKTPTIMVQMATTGNVGPSLIAFRTKIDPVLPIAIESLVIDVLFCQCGFVSSQLAEMRFVLGFGPDDHKAFMRRYREAIAQIPVAQILSRDPQPPYRQLKGAIEAVLVGVGAFATALQIVPRPGLQGCIHPK